MDEDCIEATELSRLVIAYVATHEGIDVPQALAAFQAWAVRHKVGAVGALAFRRFAALPKLQAAHVEQFARWVAAEALVIEDRHPLSPNVVAALSGDLDGPPHRSDTLADTCSGYWHRVFTFLSKELPPPVLAARVGLHEEVLRRFCSGDFPRRLHKDVAEKAQRTFVVLMARRMGIRDAEIDDLVR